MPPLPSRLRSDSTPILVELRDRRQGLLRFLVRVCAVVGGAFAVTGLIDKIVWGLVSRRPPSGPPKSHDT